VGEISLLSFLFLTTLLWYLTGDAQFFAFFLYKRRCWDGDSLSSVILSSLDSTALYTVRLVDAVSRLLCS
jgi:hypothetical protein